MAKIQKQNTRKPRTNSKNPKTTTYGAKNIRRPAKRIKNSTKKLLIPNAQNDYRPHLIRRYGLLALIIFTFVLHSFYYFYQDSKILGENSDINSAELLSYTNTAREENDLEPLKTNDKLSEAANEKAADMVKEGYWSHTSPDGTTPWYWIDKVGYTYSTAGENLARGFTSSSSIVNAWMNSPSHRANVLNGNYTEVGFAEYYGKMDNKQTMVVVAMYAQPSSSLLATSNSEQTNESGEISDGTTSVGKTENSESLITRFKRGLESLSPALMVTLVVLAVAAIVSVIAHFMRKKLSPQLQKTWYLHHGIYKLIIIVSVALVAVILYGGGMI